MVQEGDNLRGAIREEILMATPKFTFADWRRLAFDTRVMATTTRLPELLNALKDAFAIGSASSGAADANRLARQARFLNAGIAAALSTQFP